MRFGKQPSTEESTKLSTYNIAHVVKINVLYRFYSRIVQGMRNSSNDIWKLSLDYRFQKCIGIKLLMNVKDVRIYQNLSFAILAKTLGTT